MSKISSEEVNAFLNGTDPMERITTIECDYQSGQMVIVYNDAKGIKRIKKDDFLPFVWAKNSAAIRLYGGDRAVIKQKLAEYHIGVKALKTTIDGKPVHERIEEGYKYLFFAKRRMNYTVFLEFFSKGGVPIHDKSDSLEDQSREYISVTPIEQYMMRTGRRLFKGYQNYNDLKRFVFDLETQGLNPEIHRIEQIGVRMNTGYEDVFVVTGETKEEKDRSELHAIDQFLQALAENQPDIVIGHNSENFDWSFIIVRCNMLGTSLEEMSERHFAHPIKKRNKPTTLKLGGEIEYFYPTVMWGHVILDSLHAARRAQAIDSNMKSSNLKYLTKYLGLVKPNRVYVQGDKISTTWNDLTDSYAFNNENGDWYKVTDERPLQEGYELKSGRYIVKRYLLDDLWETDKVEDKLNEANFLIGKMLPTTFNRACTMGTAGIWKLIMLAWSFEHDLAIPAFSPNKRFTGGLSRLLKTGYVDNIVKLDYNSLYPSVILTWNISTPIDFTNVMLSILEYVLTQREKYKQLKAEAGDKASELGKKIKGFKGSKHDLALLKEEQQYWKSEKNGNDKKQLPLKILANSFFGGYGSPNVFPYGDLKAAEKVTCISRMLLRLMISHFKKLSYEPIVGDSVLGDTPLFVKYDANGLIDIVPISELIDKVEVDALGREYDNADKPYKVLCRSGWVKPNYLYRHKTNKDIYEVTTEAGTSICLTEDHSLFNENREEIKPSEITADTKLEFYTGKIEVETVTKCNPSYAAQKLLANEIDRVPTSILNGDIETITTFIKEMTAKDWSGYSKTCKAGLLFLLNRIKENKETN